MVKCPACQSENKDTAKSCKKCGQNLQLPPLWRPTWAWHRKSLLIIYAVIIVAYFALKIWLKPYIRTLPSDITPWMHPKGSVSSNAR
jgi:hypothetical protein